MNFNVPISSTSFFIPVCSNFPSKEMKSAKQNSQSIINNTKKTFADQSRSTTDSAKKPTINFSRLLGIKYQNYNQLTPRKSLASVNSRLREETISSSIKKFTKTVKFTNPEDKQLQLSNKKPSIAPNHVPTFGKSAQINQNATNPFQSSFAGAAAKSGRDQTQSLFKENNQSVSTYQVPNFKTDNKRNALIEKLLLKFMYNLNYNDTSFNYNNFSEPPNQIEIFKNSNFSLIELMKKTQPVVSSSLTSANIQKILPNQNQFNLMLQEHRMNNQSQISTPRLTPLKMLERNRPNVVSKDDINKLEDKIKDLEDQIFFAKKKGEENKKLDFLEFNLKQTENSFIGIDEKRDQNNSTQAHGGSGKVFEGESEEDLLNENKIMAIQQTPHVFHNFSEHLEESSSINNSCNQDQGACEVYNLRNRKSVDPHQNQTTSRMSISRQERNVPDLNQSIDQEVSNLDLNSSFVQLFSIIKQLKMEPSQKTQMKILQQNIAQQLEHIQNQNVKKRQKKSARKLERPMLLQTEVINDHHYDLNVSQRSSISPFDYFGMQTKTPKGKSNHAKDLLISQVVTRSQKKRKRRQNPRDFSNFDSDFNKRRRL